MTRTNLNPQYVCLPTEQLLILVGIVTRVYHEGTLNRSVITIIVNHLPEGVWLAYSDDLPGLIVETDTREEIISLARDLALELMELRGEGLDSCNRQFAFIFPPS